MKKRLLFFIPVLISVSCMKSTGPDIHETTGSFLAGPGAFILNEGNFNGGNGSLSFYSYDSAKIYNNVFMSINKRPLGDIPFSMVLQGDKAYIVVNNSGKIEVVDRNNLESINTINGLISPRQISFIDDTKAYVSSLYSDSIVILNILADVISGFIDIDRPSEAIVSVFRKVFVAHWTGGNKILVINALTNHVIDSIEVGLEPESMVLDKNNMLWVLCNGGWQRNNYAELIGINTTTHSIEKRFTFPLKTDSPLCLQIHGEGETLYYLHNGVRRMSITASELPETPFIPESEHHFYRIGINPANGDIFVTDAVDYQQRGYVLRYKKDGTLISTMQAGIIPGSMCFKL